MYEFYRRLARDVAIGIVVAVVGIVVIGARSSNGTKLKPLPTTSELAEARQRMYAATRATLSTELPLARVDVGPHDAAKSVEMASAVLQARAGLTLDPAALDRLKRLERSVASGKGRRLSTEELVDIFVSVGLERARNLSDAEIDHAAKAFRNVFDLGHLDDATLQDPQRMHELHLRALRESRLGKTAEARSDQSVQYLAFRYTGGGGLPEPEFIERAKDIRSLLRVRQQELAIAAMAREMVANDLQKRTAMLQTSMPEAWSTEFTPVQVLLLAYSAASDDAFLRTTSSLKQRASEVLGTTNPENVLPPFGPRGALFSSPVDLAFDPQTLNRLLDRIEERSAR